MIVIYKLLAQVGAQKMAVHSLSTYYVLDYVPYVRGVHNRTK